MLDIRLVRVSLLAPISAGIPLERGWSQRRIVAVLLALRRGHWSIENNLFGIRDATFGEDACRVRTGHGPQNLAAIRNLTVGLLNLIGCANKAAAVAARRLREPP